MKQRPTAHLLIWLTLLALGVGTPLIAQAGLLSGGCDAGIETDCLAKEWFSPAPTNKSSRQHPSSSGSAIDDIISPELRRQLDERIEKEQQEFEKFLTDTRNQPVTKGLQTTAPLPNKPTPDISYNPLAERLADSHIAEIQTSLQTELDKRSSRSAGGVREEWFEPVAAKADSGKKAYETTYEKPLLMKILERLYAFDMVDFIILVVLLAIARVAIMPFTRI